MLKIKYSDEKYLCRYDLDMRLFENLGIDIVDLWPTRNIYMLDSKQGKKILKMIDYSEERLNFICKTIEYIKKGYDNILVVNTLPNNKKNLEWNNEKYILLDYIEGVEFGVANPIEIEIASKGVALMHNASDGILSILTDKEIKENSGIGNLESYFNHSKSDLIKFKKQVENYKYREEFDELFISEVDYHIAQIDKCNELLRKSKYSKMCNDNKYLVLCHNDLAYHNILIKDEVANFIDFDYCEIDLRVKDIWNFTIKSIKRFGFSIEIFDSIIENYNKIYNISKEEFELLYVYFNFPSDFYIASKEYYLKLKDWSYESYLNKFKNKLEYTPEKELILKHLKDKYLDN